MRVSFFPKHLFCFRQMTAPATGASPFILIPLFFFCLGQINAQACCSGGVPVAANIGLPPSSGKTLQVRLSYDLNVLKTLKSGTDVLDDDSRTRRTHSILMEAGYSFSKRISIDGFFSWVRQERVIKQFGKTGHTSTNGIGDAVLLAKYRIWGNSDASSAFTTGLGVKFPLGPTDRKGLSGLTAGADLQPGSGAWDMIFWNQFTTNLAFRPSSSFSALAVFSRKGENDGYLGNQLYQFGDELQLAVSVSDRLLLGSLILDPSVEIRFRKAWEDIQNEQGLASTGGQWVFVSPGLSWWLSPDWSVNASVAVPLFADVDGTQLTPTYRVNVGVFWRFGHQ